MIVSEARREANRRNSLSSTGPKSIEGKARVRANAVKHGMTAETVVDDAEAFKKRVAEWDARLQPVDETQRWFVDEIARVTLKLDRLPRVEQALRDDVALRAETCWDGDRRLDAEVLARGLADRPAETVIRLERTVHGCEWMIERWMMLADIADHRAEWDDAQVKLAFDLTGTPVELRASDPCVRLDADGRRMEIPGGQAGFARLEVDRLRGLRDDLAELDDFERTLTAADLSDASTTELRRFRRYETTLQNRLKWCLKQFEPAKTARPANAIPPKPKPVVPAPRIEEKSNSDAMADGMLAWMEKELDAAGVPPARTFAPSRVDRKLDKAESRREAKQRKLERRRA